MNEEDEAFEAIDKAQGWRKRQIEQELGQPIYFKPRKEWVDLTEPEMDEVIDNCPRYHGRFSTKDPNGKLNYYELIQATQEKLKEKNHV